MIEAVKSGRIQVRADGNNGSGKATSKMVNNATQSRIVNLNKKCIGYKDTKTHRFTKLVVMQP